MNAFDTLEQQLRHSTQRRYGRRHRRAWRLVPAVAVLLAIAVLAARPGHNAIPADEREAAPAPAPWTPVLGDDRRGHPSISRDPVPAAQAQALGVLRRPQTAADRSAGVRRLLRLLDASTNHGVRVDAVRLLARHGNDVTILVPIKRKGNPIRGVPDSKAVFHDALCLMAGVTVRGKFGGAGGTCGTLATLDKGRLGWPGPPFGVVPDGVASVKLRVRGGRTVTAEVRGNVYDLRQPSNAGMFAIQPARWFGADGHEIPKG